MGNFVNKFLSHNNNDVEQKIKDDKIQINNDKTPVKENTTPQLTPENGLSPEFVNITPKTPKIDRKISALPKYLQTKPYLETDIDSVISSLPLKKCVDPRSPNCAFPRTPILVVDKPSEVNTPKIVTSIGKERYKILGLDPRSPAADFDRTPILLPRSLERLKARSQENLARRGSYEVDVYNSRFSYCESMSSFSTPEIQVLQDLTVNNAESISSPEIEYMDSKFMHLSNSSVSEITSNSEEEITVIKNPKFNSIRSNLPLTIDLTRELSMSDMENSIVENVESDTTKHSNILNKTSIPPKNNEVVIIWDDTVEAKSNDIPIIKEINEENVEEKQSQVSKEDIIIIYDSQGKFEDTRKRKKPLKLDSKALIEKRKLFSPDNKNGNEIQKNRTPLGNRSNSNQMQELAVKSPLRSKAFNSKMQQENTPPHKKCVKSRLNGIQWDSDSTVII